MEDSPSPAATAVTKRAALYVASVLIAGCIIVGYAVHEHHISQDLGAQNQQLTAELRTTSSQISTARNQIDDLTAKVNALASQPPAPSAPSPTESQQRAVARSRKIADARLKKLQSQVNAQGKAIEDTRTDLANTRSDLTNTQGDVASTRGDLANTRTELTGSIARTHDELVLLQKKGERNYYEFDIPKSKQFQREGPFGIRLKKASEKHQFADLQLMVDDRNLSQKHVNLYQPVTFYTPDNSQPVEVVINSISKDHIHGYVSAPKYQKSELASMPNPAAGPEPSTGQATASSGTQASSREKLSSPQ
jgi:uncharacterized coiled-coil protein SlyX